MMIFYGLRGMRMTLAQVCQHAQTGPSSVKLGCLSNLNILRTRCVRIRLSMLYVEMLTLWPFLITTPQAGHA